MARPERWAFGLSSLCSSVRTPGRLVRRRIGLELFSFKSAGRTDVGLGSGFGGGANGFRGGRLADEQLPGLMRFDRPIADAQEY
jgi:hypothetical protein